VRHYFQRAGGGAKTSFSIIFCALAQKKYLIFKAQKCTAMQAQTQAKPYQARSPFEQALFDNPALYHSMIYIQGGSFMMGDDPDPEYKQKVIRKTQLSDYYLAQYPVTQALYNHVMGDENPSSYQEDSCPVANVSHDDTQVFIKALNKACGLNPEQGYRLPTEAQWEYAAKGGIFQDPYPYSGGHRLEELGWFEGNNEEHVYPVGLHLPNSLDLYDMSGNVSEWCADRYFDPYRVGDNIDPKGPVNGSYRMLRGGSWGRDASYCRVSYRNYNSPSLRGSRRGFRLVLP
jgi:formylglycine-generating enzyme required for sulfatase activity